MCIFLKGRQVRSLSFLTSQILRATIVLTSRQPTMRTLPQGNGPAPSVWRPGGAGFVLGDVRARPLSRMPQEGLRQGSRMPIARQPHASEESDHHPEDVEGLEGTDASRLHPSRCWHHRCLNRFRQRTHFPVRTRHLPNPGGSRLVALRPDHVLVAPRLALPCSATTALS